MDNEPQHTRSVLHMEAFTDAQMWGFSEKWGDTKKHRAKERKSTFMGFILGAGLE